MNNKRLLAILRAALMTASMTACGTPAETEITGTDEVLETVETEAVPENDMEARKLVSDNLPDKDFGGEDFTILGYDFTYGYMYAEELNGDVFNDALFNRNTGVAERFNVNMNILGEADYNGTSQIIKTAVLSGEDTYDLVAYHYVQMGNDLLSDVYLNFRDVPYINFENPWWNNSTENLLTYKGRTFLAFGSLDLTTISQASCFFYNMSMGEQYEMEDIFSLVMEGKFTIDKVAEMGKIVYKDVDGNGVKDATDQYGYGFSRKGDADGYLQSFGKKLVEVNDDGSMVLDRYYDEKLVSIMEKLNALQSNEEWVWSEDAWNVGFNRFVENTLLFGHGYIAMTQWGMRDSEIDYAVLPVPKWDEAQDNYYITVGGSGDAQAVLRTASNLEKIGIVTEALNAESWKTCEAAYYENTIKYKSTRAEENVEVLDMMMESRIFDFGSVYGGWSSSGGGATFWMHEVLNKGSADIASYYQSKKSTWEGYMESVLAAFENYES